MTTPTTNFAWGKPIVNADSNTWGTELNTIFDSLDTALGSGSSGADLNPKSIKFASGTKLDHYDEGTWTPADASGASLSLTINRAIYRRIGNLVTIQASITYPVTASGSNASLSGLPFAVPASGGASSFTGISSTFATVVGGGSTINLFQINGTAQSNSSISGGTLVFSITYSVT